MKKRRRIDKPFWFTDKVIREYLSLTTPYLTGRLLDAGCGKQPYRDMLQYDEYVGLEMNECMHPDVVGEVTDMHMFRCEEFDSVLSNQVLEHVHDFRKATHEFWRVLKPGGYLCVTVPFIARLHGTPHDYWRFSEFGIRYFLESNGFDVVLVEPMGGFFTTQCYLWLFFIFEKTARCRLTRYMCMILMVLLNPLFWLIHRLDRDRTTPFNYIALARKPK